jgi:hypothetical protein
MRLRKTVQQDQWFSAALAAREDAPDLGVDPVALKAGKEIVAHGAAAQRYRMTFIIS